MTAAGGVEVVCQRRGCGDVYTAHDAGGGACQAGAEDRECWCPGFLWVDPAPAADPDPYPGRGRAR